VIRRHEEEELGRG